MVSLSLESAVDAASLFPLVKQLYPAMSIADCEARFCDITQQGNYQLLLARDKEALIAMCGIWQGTKLWCGRYMEIDNLVVDTHYRGQGISKMMMAYLIDYAKAEQCDAIALDVFQQNEAANAFYDGAGFEKPGYHRMLWLNDESRTIGMGLNIQSLKTA